MMTSNIARVIEINQIDIPVGFSSNCLMSHFAVCRIPKYCSKECQKFDWINGGHKILHKIYKEEGVI